MILLQMQGFQTNVHNQRRANLECGGERSATRFEWLNALTECIRHQQITQISRIKQTTGLIMLRLFLLCVIGVICGCVTNNLSGSLPAQSPSAADDLGFARSSRVSRKPKQRAN